MLLFEKIIFIFTACELVVSILADNDHLKGMIHLTDVSFSGCKFSNLYRKPSNINAQFPKSKSPVRSITESNGFSRMSKGYRVVHKINAKL